MRVIAPDLERYIMVYASIDRSVFDAFCVLRAAVWPAQTEGELESLYVNLFMS
jgi:hypothetical protein